MIKNFITNNNVTFYTDFSGSRVILLEGVIQSKNDMPRLYAIAREKLNEINTLLRMAA